ncbi:hypothetical protein HOY80DRAFT_1027902 [Tuber brumale]|nr:hypothetical protein HOY80DRAFT_1027902 [Tuber brumale]
MDMCSDRWKDMLKTMENRRYCLSLYLQFVPVSVLAPVSFFAIHCSSFTEVEWTDRSFNGSPTTLARPHS